MGACNKQVKVRTHSGVGLNIRTGPGLGYPRISGWEEGAVFDVDQEENGWYHHSRGWSCGSYLIVTIDRGGGAQNQSPTPQPPPIPEMTDDEKALLNSLHDSFDINNSNIDNLRYLYGAPYQFTEVTDPRPEGSELGRVYLQHCLGEMSLMVVTPCKPVFMPHFGERASNALLTNLLGSSRNEEEASSLKKILEGKETGRYYQCEPDYTEYMKYVNNMARLMAQMLGIGEREFYNSGKPYKSFDWDLGNMGDGKGSTLFSYLTQNKSVGFFIDGKESSFSDGINNSTGESMLASAIGKGSDYVKEALFLFGKGYQDSAILDTSKTNYEGAIQKVISSLTKKDTLAKQVTDRVSEGATTLINGGNISFPELWKDSNYNKNYDIVIKLISPYGDVESLYLNIMVPLCHLIALAYPRQMGANGYTNPPLLRVFCQGWFDSPMCMIDSMTIKRASQDGWSVTGQPTEVDVSISLKDLYQNMTLSRAGDYSTFHNTEFMDMISTWCGVDLNKPELQRKLNFYEAFTKNKFTELFPNAVEAIAEHINNKINRYLS